MTRSTLAVSLVLAVAVLISAVALVPVPTLAQEPTATPAAQSLTAVVTAEPLNVRTGPGTEYRKVGHLSKGDAVTVVGRNTDSSWLSITTAQLTGWVSAQYVDVTGDVAALPVIDWASQPATTPPATPVITPATTARAKLSALGLTHADIEGIAPGRYSPPIDDTANHPTGHGDPALERYAYVFNSPAGKAPTILVILARYKNSAASSDANESVHGHYMADMVREIAVKPDPGRLKDAWMIQGQAQVTLGFTQGEAGVQVAIDAAPDSMPMAEGSIALRVAYLQESNLEAGGYK